MYFVRQVEEAQKARLDNIRPEYLKRTKKISLHEYKKMRLSSYEREHLLPLFSDETLIHIIENNMKNTSIVNPPGSRPAATYEQALIFRLLPELLKRYKIKS